MTTDTGGHKLNKESIPRMSRGKAIKLFCHECCGYDGARNPEKTPIVSYSTAGHEVKRCLDKKCPLWPFRQGREINGDEPLTKEGGTNEKLTDKNPKTKIEQPTPTRKIIRRKLS